jgi:hypothetical protein
MLPYWKKSELIPLGASRVALEASAPDLPLTPSSLSNVAVAAHWATASEEVDDAQRDCGGEDAERNSFGPRSLAGVLRRDLGSTSQRCGRKTGRKHVATRFSTRPRRPCASYRRLRYTRSRPLNLSLAQPRTRSAVVRINEDDAGLFEGALYCFDGAWPHRVPRSKCTTV